MPRIEPFAGVRFDASRLGHLDSVVAPPYDVISPGAEADLRSRSEHNIVRIDLPRDEEGRDRYVAAGALYEQWLRDGVLVRDPEPSLYVMEQHFVADGRARSVIGVVAAVGLEPLGTSILPHEETLVGPHADRLSLMRTTRANLSPIYGVYSDPARAHAATVAAITARPFLAQATDDAGVRQRLWATSDPAEIATLTESIAPHPIFIADGHHRYKTALAYSEQRRQKARDAGIPADRVLTSDLTMMFLVDVDDSDLTILGVHRLVRNVENLNVPALLASLSERFELSPSSRGEPQDLLRTMQTGGGGRFAFGLYVGHQDPFYVLRLRPDADVDRLVTDPHSAEWKRLDVTLLHRLVVESALGIDRANVENQRDVRFTNDATEAIRAVDSGDCQLALFLNPTPIQAVQSIAHRGETMPQKSTYFYPKPLTGLVINPLD